MVLVAVKLSPFLFFRVYSTRRPLEGRLELHVVLPVPARPASDHFEQWHRSTKYSMVDVNINWNTADRNSKT